MHKVLRAGFDYFRNHPLVWRILALIVLLSILLSNVRPGEIAAAFMKARPQYLGIVLIFLVPNLFLQAYKWHFLLRTITPRPPMRQAIASLFGGFFLGAVSPARTGELARGLFIPGHSKLKIASLTALDKGFNHVTTYTASFFALFLALPWPLKLLPLLAETILVTLIVRFHRFRPMLERFCHRFSKKATVDNLLAAFDALSARTVLGMFALSVVFFLVYTTQFYFIILCFTDLDWTVAVRTVPLIYAINLVMPITIGDLGVKEMASVKLLGPFGIAGGAAVSASLTQNLLTFIIPSLAGGAVLMLNRGPRRPAGGKSSDVGTVPCSD
ncbi:MAG: lysylphosphatidylglycerol synthase transmembrane domain-containing protein [Candidatus Latescibacterota bacterium]